MIFVEAEKIESSHRAETLRDLIHCYLKKEQTEEAVVAWVRSKAGLGGESMIVLEALAQGPANPSLASNDQLKKFFETLKPELNQEEADVLDEAHFWGRLVRLGI